MKKLFTVLLGLLIIAAAFGQTTVDLFPGEIMKLEFFKGKASGGKVNVFNIDPGVAEYNEATGEITGIHTGSTILNVSRGPDREWYEVNVVNGKLSADGTYTIGDHVTRIGPYEIKNQYDVKKIVFGKNIEEIDDYAFLDFMNLEGELVIPGHIKRIGDWAFAFCSNLTSIVLEEGVEYIGSAPFNSCGKVTEVTFPASLTRIEDSLGLGYGEPEIICEEDSYAEEVFKKQKYYVPSCFKVAGDTLVVKEGTVYIPTEYKGKGTVKNMVLPDSIDLNEVNPEIFNNMKIFCDPASDIALFCKIFNFDCDAIDSPAGQAVMAAVNGTAIPGETAVNPSEKLVEMSALAAMGDIGLLSGDGTLTINDNVKKLDSGDIQDKEKIRRIVFGKGLESIGAYAFSDCPNLEGELVIPGNVKTVGGNAFAYCPKLTSVVLEEGVESIGYGVFNGSDSITEVTLPESLKRVDGWLGLLYGSADIICAEDSFAENYFMTQRYYVPSCFKVTGPTLEIKEGTCYFPENFKGKGTVKNIVIPNSIDVSTLEDAIPDDVKIYCNKSSAVSYFCMSCHPNYEIITASTVIPKEDTVVAAAVTVETDASAEMDQEDGDRVGPLLKTVWGPREGYLQFAENRQSATCEPLAIANLLFYHNIPLSGNHYYKTSKKDYFQDFDRFSADYTQCLLDMRTERSDAKHYDTDLLLYNCAIVLNRDWLNATRDYYGIEIMLPDYAPVKIIRNSYAWPKYDYCSRTKEEFEDIIRTNLQQKRPLMYSIHSKDGKYNHLTVIDGYRYADDGTFEVHVDAGWEGKETKWSPLWGSFDAIDSNGLRTYDGENRFIYEFIPLTGSEKENWQPKRVSEAEKKEYTKLINTALYTRQMENESAVAGQTSGNQTSGKVADKTADEQSVIPVKEILETFRYFDVIGIVDEMSLENSKVTLAEAAEGNAKTELIISGSGLNKYDSLEISYFGDSFIPVEGMTKLKLEVPKTANGIHAQRVSWDIPVPKKEGAYQIRIYADGKIAYNPLIYYPEMNYEIIVYDEPRISEVIAGNVGVNAISDSVKVTVIGEGFTTVDDPEKLFYLDCRTKDIIRNAKVTVVTDRLAYVEIKNPKKKGDYSITISDREGKSKKQFTLSVKDYSSWKIGDFVYTDGTRSSEYNSRKSVAAVIFGFSDEGTPLGVSLSSTHDDLGVGIKWAKATGAEVSSYSMLLLTDGLIDEYSFGAWNYWKEFHLEADNVTGEWKGDFDGKDNLAIVRSVDPVYSTPEKLAEYYPAFGYAENYASYHKELLGTEFEKGWYIPTMMELKIMSESGSVINESLRKAGGISTSQTVASSSTEQNLRMYDNQPMTKGIHACWNFHLYDYRPIRAF